MFIYFYLNETDVFELFLILVDYFNCFLFSLLCSIGFLFEMIYDYEPILVSFFIVFYFVDGQ